MLEVREKTLKGKEEAFIDCHSLLHNTLSPESISALLHDLKRKEKYKKRRIKYYITLWRRNPSYCSPLPRSDLLKGYI